MLNQTISYYFLQNQCFSFLAFDISPPRYRSSLVQPPQMVSAIECLVNGKFKAKPSTSSFETLDFNEVLEPVGLNNLRSRVGIASVEILKGKLQVID